MTKVLGIDIGAKFVVAFCLEGLPQRVDYQTFYKRNAKISMRKIRLDNMQKKEGVDLQNAIALLEEISPDVIVMEPTGVWYSRLWAKIAEHLGIEVKWIGHADLAYYRGAYGFKDKDDRTDAFCLALTYFDPTFNARNRWLTWRTGPIARVNNLLLEIKSLEVSTVVLTNQLRQRLKYEFPEIAGRAINNSRTHEGFTAWVGWLAGIHNYTRINNERKRSIATQLGIEISQYTRDHAAALAGNQIREERLTVELSQQLYDPAFHKYRDTFELFEFGCTMSAVILTNIYPIEKFLRDGQPVIDRWEDDRGWHKKNRSQSAFQFSLGMGKRLIESGSSTTLLYAGSKMARQLLYCWIMTNVLPERMVDSWLVTELDRRALTGDRKVETIAQLRDRWQATKGSPRDRHMAGVRSAMTIAYRMTRLLYDCLLKEV